MCTIRLSTAELIVGNDKGAYRLRGVRHLDAQDSTGFQFGPCRGLVVIESPIGQVTVLPMGMAQRKLSLSSAEKIAAGRVKHEKADHERDNPLALVIGVIVFPYRLSGRLQLHRKRPDM